MFTVERRLITPEIARTMLEKNVGNRKPRTNTFLAYERDMRAGKWVETHEAIAVSKSGNIINGQHRLMALARAEVSLWFLVVTYDDAETAIQLPIDCGAKRSLADITGESVPVTQAASALWRYVLHGHQVEPRVHELTQLLAVAKPTIEQVVDVSRSNRRFKASAMARSAIVASLLTTDPQYSEDIIESYRKWVDGENASWPSVEALNKQCAKLEGRFNGESWCKIFVAFSPDKKHLRIIRLNDMEQSVMLHHVRKLLRSQHKGFAELFAQKQETE
jgi:hypothetical protein